MFKVLISILILTISYQVFPQEHKRPKVGLVLSGGGAKGLAHIGVIKVLEQSGIPIDYIGGTSMGSIIGALYALNYPADSLQKLVSTQDWAFLLTDRISRKYLSFEEKEFDGKYFIPYPVNEGRFQMPSAMVSGQNLEMLLSRMMVQAQADTNFLNFPIPFFCVATDLENGKADILKSGWPVTAVRASMSIPTVFCPVKMNGKTYVDGGIYNNFPVDEMKAMGADIIIGVDVGFSPFHGNELNSMLRIIEQTIFTHTVNQNTLNQQKCDIFIKPQLGNYNMMSFDAADSIVEIGKNAALLQKDKLQHLADSLKSFTGEVKKKNVEVITQLSIDQIKVEGFQKIPRTYIESKLNLIPGKLKIEEIEEGVRRVYGCLLFKKVSYRIDKDAGKKVLIVEVQERPQSIFSLGINYNTEYRASIYFNTTFYNLLLNGSKLTINALLGEDPRVNTNYFIFSGWNPKGKSPFMGGWRFDFGINAGTNNYRIYDYLNGQRIASNEYTDVSFDVYTQTVFNNSYAWGIGILNEFTSKKPDINPFVKFGTNTQLLAFHSYLKFDTYNRTYFPSSGNKLDIKARYLTNMYDDHIFPGLMVSGNFGMAISLSKRISLLPQASSGISFNDSIPDTYVYRLGGLCTHYTKNSFPFVGIKLLEVSSPQFISAGLGTQIEIFNRNFITLRANYLNLTQKTIDLFDKIDIQDGYSISYGYYSPVGPMELTFMTSSKYKALLYLNLGFWF